MPVLLAQGLANGEYSQILQKLYHNPEVAALRWSTLIEGFKTYYKQPEAKLRLFSAPGRVEIGGNHTDHQNGCVIAAAINLDTACAAVKTNSGIIRIKSVGHKEDIIDLTTLETARHGEENHAASLIRGICVGLKQRGYEIGGFNAYTSSEVKSASGLSSSAAFEIAIGTILSYLYNDGEIPPIELAQIGQFAENHYFGKPCGLMDQAASAVGGFVFFDFENPANPLCERIPFDFSASGHRLIITHTGGGHGELTGEYSAITGEMTAVAEILGATRLREAGEAAFSAAIPQIRERLGDRAVLRAMHFFAENRRAKQQAISLCDGDFDEFKRLVRDSGKSSFCYLQNLYVSSSPLLQPLSLAVALSEQILESEGAFRVHGGGFAGTILAIVPTCLISEYTSKMAAVFGEGACEVLSIRESGGIELLPNQKL